VGVSPSYFTRILKLSFLAPDIVQAILGARHPLTLTGPVGHAPERAAEGVNRSAGAARHRLISHALKYWGALQRSPLASVGEGRFRCGPVCLCASIEPHPHH
jgi:hypothetical protein